MKVSSILGLLICIPSLLIPGGSGSGTNRITTSSLAKEYHAQARQHCSHPPREWIPMQGIIMHNGVPYRLWSSPDGHVHLVSCCAPEKKS